MKNDEMISINQVLSLSLKNIMTGSKKVLTLSVRAVKSSTQFGLEWIKLWLESIKKVSQSLKRGLK